MPIPFYNFDFHDYLFLGLGPVFASILGYAFAAIPLELLIRCFPSIYEKYGIKHSKQDASRLEAVNRTQAKIPLDKQLRGVAVVLLGPTAIVNSFVSYLLLSSFIMAEHQLLLPTISQFLLQFIGLQLVGDFFLYWGHRIQHEIPFLWNNFHCLHHTLDTPSPIGTIYIDPVDATLQAGLPIILAASICRPNLVTIYCYTFCRIAENTVNHSGLNWPLLNIIACKYLPGRASIAHHDAHHKYSNYAARAKNYGENFWIWDYIFGTLRGGIA